MAKLTDIIAFLDEHLAAATYADVGLNGLQVEGKSSVRRLALGVSVSAALINEAAAWNADAILVHHGLFWGRVEAIKGAYAGRLKALLSQDISLIAYHIPLDAHASDGNNAQLAKQIGLQEAGPWGDYKGKRIGVLGRLPAPVELSHIVPIIAQTCRSKPVVLGDRTDKIATVAVCSGGGGSMLTDAIDAGADLFVTGEPGEPAQELAREAGVAVVGAGHYGTERLGVQAIGARLGKIFGIETRYIEIDNPM